MKIFIVIFSLMFTVLKAEQKISDINYFLSKGQSKAVFGMAVTRGEIDYSTGTDLDTDSAAIVFLYEYGLTEKLTIGADINRETFKVEASGGTQSKRKGFTDPTFNLEYRVQSDEKTQLDLSFSLTPYTGKNRPFGNAGSDGNSKSGKTTLEFSPSYFSKINEMTIFNFEVSINYQTKTKFTDGDFIDSLMGFSASSFVQFRVDPKVTITPSLSFLYDESSKNQNDEKVSSSRSYVLTLSSKYDISKESYIYLELAKAKVSNDAFKYNPLGFALGYIFLF